jgi:hypothetical protein
MTNSTKIIPVFYILTKKQHLLEYYFYESGEKKKLNKNLEE